MSKKSTFDLKLSASNIKEIHRKYELASEQNNTTSIETIENSETLQFLDETRKIHKCMLSKIDFAGSDNYCCYWCRHSISEIPVGCPVKYVPSMIHKSYFSEINKEKFMVKESMISPVVMPDIIQETNDYYETDGIFCSLECAMAFIKDNKKNSLYTDSEILLNRIAGRKVEPAPHWRLLKSYGGHLDIKEFRTLRNVEYIQSGIHKPFFKSVAHTFEQKIKL